MNEPSAFYTFQMEMTVTFRIAGVLVAGSAFFIYHEFPYFSRGNKPVKSPVYRSNANGMPLSLKTVHDIGNRYVRSAFLDKFKYKGSLLCAVFSPHYS